jgi:hypothetical protein
MLIAVFEHPVSLFLAVSLQLLYSENYITVLKLSADAKK